MTQQAFTSMSDAKIAKLIGAAVRRVALAVPALRQSSAGALIGVLSRVGHDAVTVVVDCDEEVFRLGYGELAAIELITSAGIHPRHCSGLRIGVLICDDSAWLFSPTALYVQDEVHSDETPNAVVLRAGDVDWLFSKLAASADAQAESGQAEIGESVVSRTLIQRVSSALNLAPPLPFDITRQVRVFQPYIQYVHISLRGCAIQRHRIEIPKSIRGIGAAPDIEGRLRTTFDLIERNNVVSSKPLEKELAMLRDNFTRALGKPWDRVLLRSVRPEFDKRIENTRKKLDDHRKSVSAQLQKVLDESRQQVVKYYLPMVRQNPPDALLGQLLVSKITDELIADWLDAELDRAFPKPESLIEHMRLEVTYRDVTYETLKDEKFAEVLRVAYPHVDWDKPFNAFNAAKESDDHARNPRDSG